MRLMRMHQLLLLHLIAVNLNSHGQLLSLPLLRSRLSLPLRIQRGQILAMLQRSLLDRLLILLLVILQDRLILTILLHLLLLLLLPCHHRSLLCLLCRHIIL